MDLALLIVLSLALGVAAFLFFLWTVRSGQYDDPEGPKYRMMEDEEEGGEDGGEGKARGSRGGGRPPGALSPPGSP
ncbi:MAG TPA: cbb3-type cytochrome oxidase assembly protein CcoS [Anaeromyxobacteraceae bacterium]|nr:cbb3-type cytochrome oxidase assembly protein CcoS [Anaeromyxobacteraceae bacterium]